MNAQKRAQARKDVWLPSKANLLIANRKGRDLRFLPFLLFTVMLSRNLLRRWCRPPPLPSATPPPQPQSCPFPTVSPDKGPCANRLPIILQAISKNSLNPFNILRRAPSASHSSAFTVPLEESPHTQKIHNNFQISSARINYSIRHVPQ